MDAQKVKAFSKEREYLENLLNSRFNFYLVFSSVFLAAVIAKDSNISENQRTALLFGGAIVSLLISISVLRTNIFINRVLKWLEDEANAPEHPWNIIKIKHPVWRKFRANRFLAAATVLITILFFVLAIWRWKYGMT